MLLLTKRFGRVSSVDHKDLNVSVENYLDGPQQRNSAGCTKLHLLLK